MLCLLLLKIKRRHCANVPARWLLSVFRHGLRLLDGLRDALGQAADPRLHIGFLSAIREARALQPCAGARRFRKQCVASDPVRN